MHGQKQIDNRAECQFCLTDAVSVIVIIGSFTGNMLPPFAVRLMFGGLIVPFELENAATYRSGMDGRRWR